MPANLSPEYKINEERYRKATSPEEKLEALKEMLRTIPKHKGTEKLQADLKSRIKEMTEQAQKQKKRGTSGSSGYFYNISKEGAGQIVITGAPNSGKSSLVSILTSAKPEVGDYPFTTRVPTPGMVAFEDIQFQLIDLPPITNDFMEQWVPNIIRNADILLLFFDITDENILENLDAIEEKLNGKKIKLGSIEVDSSPSDETVIKRTIVVLNKIDLSNYQENLKMMHELLSEKFVVLPVSIKEMKGLDELKKLLFKGLKVIRVYTKQPAKKAELDKPYLMNIGSTILDLAEKVHKDLAQNLKFARIWGEGKIDGQRVNRDYLLKDKDIVEIHT